MINLRRCFIPILLLMVLTCQAIIPDVRFRRLDTRDGLSNSQVNGFLRDSRGFMWMPTPFGLCRYDGYRFRIYYSYEADTLTLRNNRVERVMEAADGRLWLDHGMSYSIMDPTTERVERSAWAWMQKQGIKSNAEHVYIDSQKRYWIKTYEDGFYIIDPKADRKIHMPFGYQTTEVAPDFGISAYAESKDGMVIISHLGELMCIDGKAGKVKWKDDYVKRALNAYNDYWLYVDKDGITWVITHSTGTYIREPNSNRWYTSLTEFMRAKGFENVPDDIIVWEVRYDKKGLLWVATDHYGVLLLDMKNREWRQFTNQKGDDSSLPDITAKHLYEDQLGRMWVSTYKNGVAMSSDAVSVFTSLPVGDVNAITEDKAGNWWIGLNSGGILRMDPQTLTVTERYDKHSIGAMNDVIVGSYAAKDGTLWFGTWEGGLISYHNGQWKNYTAATPGSAFVTNNIWGITEDYWGNLWIGVLGGGVVRMDKKTGKQRSWWTKNSTIKTDWTNSIARAANGWIILGNSEYCTLVNPKTMRVINMPLPHDRKTYTISAATTQALMDARGLIWQGSPSGLNIFDRKTGQSTLLDMKSGFYGSSVVAIAEDGSVDANGNHSMWVVTDHGVSHVTPSKNEEGVWTFAVRSFSDRDGLQPGPFNQRAIYYTRSGMLLVGGQDGLDIINTKQIHGNGESERPVLSELLIDEVPVDVGREAVSGRIVLDEALDVTDHLTLASDESYFTIELASNNGGAKNSSRFVYRLVGYNDRWLKTSAQNPSISYNSLPPDTYTLEVRMLRDDGTYGEAVTSIDITIRAPLWRTRWMILLYMVLIAAAAWLWRKWYMRRQQQRMETLTTRRELEKKQWMNEMRLKMQQMMNHQMKDEGKPQKPAAAPELPKVELQTRSEDLVAFLRELCKYYKSPVEGKKAKVNFISREETIDVDVDVEKVEEACRILMRNAVMFTPHDCQISIGVAKMNNGMAQIQVADNGIGINDDYKAHAFDPIVNASQDDALDDAKGIGLDWVKAVVEAHGGEIHIEDNPGGGTIFVFTLPTVETIDVEVIEE